MRKIILIIILSSLNVYLLSINIAMKSEKLNQSETEVANNLITDNIEFSENTINVDKINLIAIWGEKGCGMCKLDLSRKFNLYKQKFSKYFKFVYIGDSKIDIELYQINEHITNQFDSATEVFANPVDIAQPFLVLTNNKGRVLLQHRMIALDIKHFADFNSKAESILNLIKTKESIN